MARSNETQCERDARNGLYGLEPDHEIKVNVRHQLPAAIILVHGVNDVGTSYESIEAGLCEGLTNRLYRGSTPATYRIPTREDKEKLEPDPDAVFYRRKTSEETFSPVIPFYWGFREVTKKASAKNGERVDRFGNRLDKDLSKGGGPFANATSSIPDMWNRGINPIMAQVGGDPIRPVRRTPGRMYMVLAAMRLAALVAIIRDKYKDDVVNIVAHSQGCLITLLAQAILLEKGLAPADTLILTHPPYALDDSLGFIWALARRFKTEDGVDPGMEQHYPLIDSPQTLHARLQTLVNLVHGVVESGSKRTSSPSFGSLSEEGHDGIVGNGWRADADRDNRGKVYLYFCPEDMTVALSAVKGIGWQGVPDSIEGRRVDRSGKPWLREGMRGQLQKITRSPMRELGPRFYQRVFTEKIRSGSDGELCAELVGSARHDFILRLDSEDDHAHVSTSGREHREHLPTTQRNSVWQSQATNTRQSAVRDINGEALPAPVHADLRGGEHILAGSVELQGVTIHEKDLDGPLESVDPIDSAIATAADGGIQTAWMFLPDAAAGSMNLLGDIEESPAPEQFSGSVQLRGGRDKALESRINAGRDGKDKYVIKQVYLCFDPHSRSSKGIGFLIEHDELPDQARLRWQKSFTPKSYHSAIIGSKKNHINVTAYDVAIGAGRAVSNKRYNEFLCAIADWRKPPKRAKQQRPQADMTWEEFIKCYSAEFFQLHRDWQTLIVASKEYYATGELPDLLPIVGKDLEDLVICESVDGTYGGTHVWK